eukprot:1161773-Pelagomonas_calceolata.AAC.17
MGGEFMWIGWVSGSTLLQGTSVMTSVFIFDGTSGRGKFVRKPWFSSARLLVTSLGAYLNECTWGLRTSLLA